MSARVDVSARSIVVTCPECRVWSVLARNKQHAWALAADHDQRVHGASELTVRVMLARHRSRNTP